MVSPGRVAFSLFGIDIYWYGMIISVAILLGVLITSKRAVYHNIRSEDVLDVVLIAVPCAVIGARLYYVLFEWEMYKDNLSQIFNLRAGGLAIHGGLIFAFIAVYFACRHKGLSTLNALDLAAPSIALAQSIGRWGNFFNEEAHGFETDFPISVVIDGISYHATFLYESLWCFMMFWVLSYVDRHRKFTGQVIMLYGILYGIERFLVEYLRTDSLMIGPFKQAMVISGCIFVGCLLGYVVLRGKRSPKADFMMTAEDFPDEYDEK